MNLSRRKISLILGIILLIAILVSGIPYLPHPPIPVSFSTMDELRISSGSPEFSLLTLIAEEKGIFHNHGLNVTFTSYPSGVEAVGSMLSGTADLAYAAEFVGVNQIFKDKDLVIIGSTAKSEVISLIIRKDQGIFTPKDLRKKTIAVPKGTQAEFFLGRYLTVNGMNLSDINVQYLPPGNLSDCIGSGACDGGIIWEPYVHTIQQNLSGQVEIWPAQSGQMFYWTTYTRPEIVEQKTGILTRYCEALGESENYIINHETEVKDIMKQKLNLSDNFSDTLWAKSHFMQSFDQGLLLAMEDEARWLIKNNLTNKKSIPLFLNYMNTTPLSRIEPTAVQFITG